MITLLLTVFACVLFAYTLLEHIRQCSYWKNRGVKYVTPLPFIGNILRLILQTQSTPDFVASLYNAYPKERYIGIYMFRSPLLLIKDPALIKTISIKEFNSFVDHGTNFKEDVDPSWGKNLFATQGEKWRNLRHTLSPAFTSRKMKTMYILMEDCVNKLMDYLDSGNDEIIELEMENFVKRFTMDVIATTAFGLETNSVRNENNEFFRHGIEMTDFSGSKRLKFFLYNGDYPLITKILNLKMLSDKVFYFFHSIVKQTMDTRSKQNIIRPDFIYLMMEARRGQLHLDEIGASSTTSRGQKEFAMSLTDEDITAQATIFIFGGYDTTSRLITFCLYELAVNLDIQKKLRDEVDENVQKNESKIAYEDLFKMKYLDMVISETLRKWPPATFIDRMAASPFIIQPENEHEKPVLLQKGDICWFPVFALQRDPDYWPSPDTFDPDRFNEENRGKIVQGSYIPFGLGPRNCIGSRYAVMEAKLFIFHILANFEVVPTEKSRIPVVLEKTHIFLTSEFGLWLGLKRRQDKQEK